MAELEIKAHRATLRILDETGDTKVMWNPRDKDEVEAAESTFKRLVAKGFKAFTVDREGKPKKKLEKFDKDAEKIIMVPQMAGGS